MAWELTVNPKRGVSSWVWQCFILTISVSLTHSNYIDRLNGTKRNKNLLLSFSYAFSTEQKEAILQNRKKIMLLNCSFSSKDLNWAWETSTEIKWIRYTAAHKHRNAHAALHLSWLMFFVCSLVFSSEKKIETVGFGNARQSDNWLNNSG